MTGLTDAELAYMRDAIADLLPDRANILSVTRTPDGQGGFTEAWGTVTAGVACRIDPVRGREQVAGVALQPFHHFVGTFPHDATITETHRIEVNDSVFAVIAVDPDKSWKVATRAALERV